MERPLSLIRGRVSEVVTLQTYRPMAPPVNGNRRSNYKILWITQVVDR